MIPKERKEMQGVHYNKIIVESVIPIRCNNAQILREQNHRKTSHSLRNLLTIFQL